VGGVVAAFLAGAANGINQIFDQEIDRINKPYRPLPAGKITLCKAWFLTILCYGISLTLAWHLNGSCGILVTLGAAFTLIYSVPPLRTKRHWLLAGLTIAIPRGLLLTVAGWSVIGDISTTPEPWYLGSIFTLFLLGAHATKDYADLPGDRLGKCQTLPVVFGIEKSIWLISPFFIFPFLLFPLGIRWKILQANPLALDFLGLFLSLWGGYVLFLLLRNPFRLTQQSTHPSWKHMYLMMMVAYLGIAIAYFL